MTSIRCSDLDRILACPGSLTLCSLVAKRQGEDGAEGSCLHHDAATRIVRDLGGSAPDGLGLPDPGWPSLKVSKWISDFYLRHVSENAPEGWSLEVEAALSYEFDGFILSGHIDCVAISPDGTEAIGWDLKSGYDPVDSAEQNWQMLGYIVLLKRAYPGLQKCTFYVVQPRNDEDEGFQRVSEATIECINDEDDLMDTAVSGLVARIRLALANPLSLDTGRKQCRFCPAKLQCPATIAQRDDMKITMTRDQLAAIKSVPDDAVLADWVIAGRVVGVAIDDAEKLAKERIAATGELLAHDGTRITIKTTKGSYTVLDPLALWKAVADLLPEERRAVAAKWSFTQIDDQIAEHMNLPKSGKGVTGRSVREAKTGAFVEQGDRKIFQFL